MQNTNLCSNNKNNSYYKRNKLIEDNAEKIDSQSKQNGVCNKKVDYNDDNNNSNKKIKKCFNKLKLDKLIT